MQKKTLLLGLGIGCLGIVLVIIAGLAGIGFFLNKALTGEGTRDSAEAPAAVLRVERGSASVVSNGGASQTVPKDAETEVMTGDEITVSDDGRAAIYWHGYGRTLIDAGTKLRITEASRPTEETIQAKVLLDIGRVWTRLEQVLEVGSEVSVGTSDVVATVRGTSFGVERQGNVSSIKVKESKVAASRVGSTDTQNVEAGFKLDVGVGSTSALRAPVKMSDAELNDPFVMAGDVPVEPGLYDLTGWASSAEQWVQSGIEYLAWHPWLFLQINFGGGGSFKQWYQGLPSSVRTEFEARQGPPNYDEISRLLNW